MQERETTELKSKLAKLKEDFQYNLKVRDYYCSTLIGSTLP